jgi:hypothetical protein
VMGREGEAKLKSRRLTELLIRLACLCRVRVSVGRPPYSFSLILIHQTSIPYAHNATQQKSHPSTTAYNGRYSRHCPILLSKIQLPPARDPNHDLGSCPTTTPNHPHRIPRQKILPMLPGTIRHSYRCPQPEGNSNLLL